MMNRGLKIGKKHDRSQLSVAKNRILTPEKKGLSGVSIASGFRGFL
jgi:hypothetical protein